MRFEDGFGRVATDLRVSLTDRCNLRCTYCMPAEGLQWLPSPELLTDDELVRLVGIAVGHLGVTEVRLTGGEPTLRRGLPELVARFAALSPRPGLSLTTNGLALARLAGPLHDAGLDRVNVSIDTLSRERFVQLTRRDRLHDVLAGLSAAADAGLTPVKVNAVLMRGINDDEALPLLHFCLEHGLRAALHRADAARCPAWLDRVESMVTAAEITEAITAQHTLTALPGRGSAPAETFLVDGGPGTVGIIASVTAPFCGACDRVRLTADGQVRDCLFARTESDLRTPLRAGASDVELAKRWQVAMRGKRAGHGIDDPSFLQPDASDVGDRRVTDEIRCLRRSGPGRRYGPPDGRSRQDDARRRRRHDPRSGARHVDRSRGGAVAGGGGAARGVVPRELGPGGSAGRRPGRGSRRRRSPR